MSLAFLAYYKPGKPLHMRLLHFQTRRPRIHSFPTTLCGVLVFDSVSRVLRLPLRLPARLSTTIFHTPSFTHHLSHTIFHTPSLTDHLSYHLSQAWHLATSTFVSRGRRGTWWHPPSFCVAGVALGDIHLPFVWQAWHLVTSTFVLRGRRGTYGTAWRAWTACRRWCRGTLRGRRGTYGHLPSFCVAGIALGDIHLRFAWQAWHLWHCVARLDGLVAGDAAALCVAGVALGDIHLRFAW